MYTQDILGSAITPLWLSTDDMIPFGNKEIRKIPSFALFKTVLKTHLF